MAEKAHEKQGQTKAGVAQAASVLVTAGAAAAAAAATGADPANAAAAAGGAAALQELYGDLSSWWKSRQDANFKRWWERISQNFSGSELQDLVSKRVREDPAARTAVVASIRRLGEVVDDEVVPALADLAAEYLRDKRRPDGFFWGLSRVLQELSSDDFEGLRALVRGVRHSKVRDEVLWVKVGDFDGGLGLYVYKDRGEHQGMHFLCSPPEPARLLHLVEVNGLGAQVTGALGGAAGTYIGRATATRVDKIISPRH